MSKNNIIKKIDILIKQYEKYNVTNMIKSVNKIKKDFFSDNKNLQEKALLSLREHLNTRIWEGIGIGIGFENPKYPTYYKDNYVDNFNNFSEFYAFLESLIADAENYNRLRESKSYE